MRPMNPRSPTSLPPLLGLFLAAAAPAQGTPQNPGPNAQDLLVLARTIVLAPDAVLQDGALLVRGGKVAYVGAEIPAEARAQARRLDFGDATITPGLVNAHSWLGQEAELTEVASALTPTLRTADAFDPFQDELRRLAAAGVTSAAFPPASRNLLGGIACLVRPAPAGGPGAPLGTVVDADLYLKASLIPVARDQERAPTSLMGSVEMLRAAFERGKAPVVGAADQPLREVLQGSRRLFVHANSEAEIRAALQVCQQAGVEPVLLGAADADRCLDVLKAANARVALGSLLLDSPDRQLALPAVLARAGVRFCFAATDGEQLRLSAALAVRHGLDRKTAIDALTRAPAELLGQQARIGTLRVGCDADFAVWSGDPLDLTSSLRAAHAAGVQVHPTADAAR